MRAVLLLCLATVVLGMRKQPVTPPPGGEKFFYDFLANCDYLRSHTQECKEARKLAHEFKMYKGNFLNQTGETLWRDYKIGTPDDAKLKALDRRQVCEFYYLANTEYLREFVPVKKVEGGFHQSSIVLCKGLKEGVELNTPANCLKSCVDMFPLYNWNDANEQDSLRLPENLGYLVGPDTEYKFLGIASDYDEVRDVQYGSWNRNKPTIRNGIRVNAAKKLDYEPEYKVGLFMTGGHDDIEHGGELPAIPPRQPAFQSGKICPVETSAPIHAFQYSVHAHKTASDISVFIHDTETNQMRKIAQHATPYPKITEKYFNFNQEIEIKPTDRVVVKCTYNTMNENQPFHTGCWLRWMELCAVDIWYKTKSTEKDDLSIKCIENSIWDKTIWDKTNRL